MQLQRLCSAHAESLLTFEVNNRTWFETHIEARPEGFYSAEGVATHIAELVQGFRSGRAYSVVIERGGELLGRVNLRALADGATMSLGYRVARQHGGRGVASFGVAELLRRTHLFPHVTSVVAMVSVENPASQRVLEKNGFRRRCKHAHYAMVAGRAVDCWEYQRPWPLEMD